MGNEETLKEMKSKHPEAGLPVLPSGPLPDPVRFDKELVRKKVEGFPTGSAAGASGTRPQFLKDILSCPNKAAGDDALKSLTNLTNHMVAGLAPRELAPFIAGAPLMALVKAGGGLRPIAIGATIRRLVSKCCCEATVEDAKVIFGPLQVGVATQGGAEASVHAVRKLADEFGEDPGKIMLKVDFSNAFNLVDRTVMLAQFTRNFPACIAGFSTVTLTQPTCFLVPVCCRARPECNKATHLVRCCFPWCSIRWLERLKRSFPTLTCVSGRWTMSTKCFCFLNGKVQLLVFT